jgi:hypothetical protein
MGPIYFWLDETLACNKLLYFLWLNVIKTYISGVSMRARDERTNEALIKEYELMALSSREVYDQYKERYENSDKYKWDYSFDIWTDETLWARNDPLIKLAIAKFGKNTDIAKEILVSGEKPLKLAMLSSFNSRDWSESFPKNILETPEDVLDYIKSCPDEELYELMKNPFLDRNLMAQFFEQKELFHGLTESRQMTIAHCFGQHPMAKTPHDDRYMDGYAEYSHNRLFTLAWEFCSKVPVNKGWAMVLSSMTAKLLPEGSPFKDNEHVLEVIKRWYPVGEELSKYDDEDEYKKIGYLSSWQELRKNIAKLIYKASLKEDSEDIALRYSFYESEWLTETQMSKAFERDGLTAINAMMDNDRLWKQEKTRQKLRDLSWAADDLDESHYLDNANKFNAYEDRHKEQHSSWFVSDKTDDVDEIADENLPVTRQYIYEIAEVLQTTNNQNQIKIDALLGKVKVLIWICSIALAILIFNS